MGSLTWATADGGEGLGWSPCGQGKGAMGNPPPRLFKVPLSSGFFPVGPGFVGSLAQGEVSCRQLIWSGFQLSPQAKQAHSYHLQNPQPGTVGLSIFL